MTWSGIIVFGIIMGIALTSTTACVIGATHAIERQQRALRELRQLRHS